MQHPYGVSSTATALVSDDGHVCVRPLAAADRDDWTRLWRGYLDFYDTTLADTQYALTWQRLHDASEPEFGYLAEVGGARVGLVHIIFHRSGWTAAPACYLQDLYVDPAFRGRQIGLALIEHAWRVARSAGCGNIYWLTHETNAYAMRLYDRVAVKTGFVQYRKSTP
jgi:GNAT superfamily N-acetyltransferase